VLVVEWAAAASLVSPWFKNPVPMVKLGFDGGGYADVGTPQMPQGFIRQCAQVHCPASEKSAHRLGVSSIGR
jgi:hypothetical protein